MKSSANANRVVADTDKGRCTWVGAAAFLCLPVVCCLYRPLRGLARSNRYPTALEACDIPVGAGLPAKGPVQATGTYQASLTAATDLRDIRLTTTKLTRPTARL